MERPPIVRLAVVTSTQDVARELPIGSVVVIAAAAGGIGFSWKRYYRR